MGGNGREAEMVGRIGWGGRVGWRGAGRAKSQKVFKLKTYHQGADPPRAPGRAKMFLS